MNKYTLLIVIAFLFIIAGLFSPYLIWFYFFEGEITRITDLTELGTIGDWFGGTISPAFGLAGFIMVLAAFFAQKEELAAQKEELKLTREEFKQQNETMARQRFENTFFHLLTLHHEIVNSIKYKTSFSFESPDYVGRQYFREAFGQFSDLYDDIDGDLDGNESGIDIRFEYEKVKRCYESFYHENQDYIGHYFRNLYHIIRFIDQDKGLSEEEKRNYASLIRAQLSTYELLLIFYNSISKFGCEKFKPLIDKYDLLQNMNFSLLVDDIHQNVYIKVHELTIKKCA